MVRIQIFTNGTESGYADISEELWAKLNYVDYVNVNENGKIAQDFSVHGPEACAAMEMLAACNSD